MGSTIVMAWIIRQSVYVGWCGDSRAYRFNAATGLQRLSHDHSYVQSLVDSGMLSEASAFNHPNSNIITRSLGDPFRAALPDTTECLLNNGDVVMLCSDGLCGVLRDSEIEEVFRQNAADMESCREALWNAARQAEWNDNVTIGLCRIVSGSKNSVIGVTTLEQPQTVAAQFQPVEDQHQTVTEQHQSVANQSYSVPNPDQYLAAQPQTVAEQGGTTARYDAPHTSSSPPPSPQTPQMSASGNQQKPHKKTLGKSGSFLIGLLVGVVVGVIIVVSIYLLLFK
jgi:hypothetical protein